MPGIAADYLIQATMLEGQAHFDLTSKGYPPAVASAAVRRARGQAKAATAHYSPAIRGQAYVESLARELRGCDDWIRRIYASGYLSSGTPA